MSLDRELVIERLCDDDIDTIIHNCRSDYLRDLVMGGFKGYMNMLDWELVNELDCRGIEFDGGNE
jgi:hypothetical protein